MKTIDEKLLMEELEKLTEDYTKTEEKIKTCEQEDKKKYSHQNTNGDIDTIFRQKHRNIYRHKY